MKNSILLVIICFCLPTVLGAQEYQTFENKYLNLVQKMQTHIPFKARCKTLVREVDDLTDELESALENSSASKYEDLQSMKALLKLNEAYSNFLSAVGPCGSVGYISKSELSDMLRLFNLSLYEIDAGTYCVQLFVIKIRSYSCWLAYQSSEATYNVSISHLSDNNTSGKMTMGLMGGHYRAFMNNAEDPAIKTLSFSDVTCHKYPSMMR